MTIQIREIASRSMQDLSRRLAPKRGAGPFGPLLGCAAIAALLVGCTQSENQLTDIGHRLDTGIRFSDAGSGRRDVYVPLPDQGGGGLDSAGLDSAGLDSAGHPLDSGLRDTGGETPDAGTLPKRCINDDGHCPLACQGRNDNDCPALIESITAYGKIWRFDVSNDNPLPGNGSDLRMIPRFAGEPGSVAEHPCEPGTAPCTISTRVWVWLGGVLLDSIATRGRYWNFDGMLSDYVAYASNGSLLSTVDRFGTAGGPCHGKGAACEFDTRTFVLLSGHLIESITAYGKGWNFDASDDNEPWAENGDDLTTVPRYRDDGPCEGRAAGTCKFDTRTFVMLNGHLIESITAYGKGWNFDSDDNHRPWPQNDDDLTTVPRFRDGPCSGRVLGTCTFDSRTFIDVR